MGFIQQDYSPQGSGGTAFSLGTGSRAKLVRASNFARSPIHTGRRLASLLVFATLLAASPLRAQIGIGGVADKTVYVDQVSFIVTNTAGYALGAWLDDRPVPVGAPMLVDRV